MEEVDDIQELGPNIGPYQTEDFKEPEFTIDIVNKVCYGHKEVIFRNGRSIVIMDGDHTNGEYLPYREGLSILMDKKYYRDGETRLTRLTNDRVLFYLTLVGSE